MDWRVDLVAARASSRTHTAPEAVLMLELDDKSVDMTLTHNQLLVLLAEARLVLNQMK